MAAITAGSRPRLRRGVRLVFDATRGTRVLLYPEGVIVPNETAAEVLAGCDGVTTVGAITAELAAQYDGVQIEEVIALLDRLAQRRFVEVADEPAATHLPDPAPAAGSTTAASTTPADEAPAVLAPADKAAAGPVAAGASSTDTHPGVTHPAGIAPLEGAPAVEGDSR